MSTPDPFAEVNKRFEEQRKRLEESLRELKARPLNVVDTTPRAVETPPPQVVQPQIQPTIEPQYAPPQPVQPQMPPQAQVPVVQTPVVQTPVGQTPVVQKETQTQEMAQAAGLNKIIMEQGVAIMLAKIGQALSQEEQEWLSANLISLPGFLSSNSGKAVVKLLFGEYKNWMEK